METANHECYVSLEVAKLLKEAGFDWEVQSYYSKLARKQGRLLWLTCGCKYKENININQNRYSAPTLDVAQRWLREVKNIQIIASPLAGSKNWTPLIAKDFWLLHEGISGIALTPENFDTYEEALEAGIKKALELILKKGE